MKLTSDFLRRHAVLAFYLTAVIFMTLVSVMFWLNIYRSIYSEFVMLMAAEWGLLLSPVLFLRGRWRAVSLVILWLVDFFLFANILYGRFANDMLPLALVFQGASYNSMVFSCVPGLIRVHDILYLLLPGIPTFLYFKLRVAQAPKPRLRSALTALAASLLLYGTCLTGALLYAAEAYGGSGIVLGMNVKTGPVARFLDHFEGGGLMMYFVSEARSWHASRHKTLSPEEIAEIDSFIAKPELPPDSVFVLNHDKNLIFIVVESLNALAADITDGKHRLTPVLDSLRSLPGTISCFTMVPQIGAGTSADGQLMYNTGMLPYRPIPAALYFFTNTYEPLARRLGYERSTELISEMPSIWNHLFTTRQYEYSGLVWGIWGDGISGADKIIFKTAADSIAATQQPFYAFVTTTDTHYPFNMQFNKHQDWIEALGRDRLTTSYLNALHNTDREIGVFLERLDSIGVLENSVVAIASDHHTDTMTDWPESPSGYEPTVFMALNTGKHIEIDCPVGQIDVFPTLMQIMDRREGWQGLGMSMLDPANRSSVDARGTLHGTSGDSIDARKRRAWEISDEMISGDYHRLKR